MLNYIPLSAVIDESRHASCVRAVEELLQHELMVAEKAYDAAILLKVENGVDHAARDGTPVDVVSKEHDERIFAKRQFLDERAQLFGAAVHVSNREKRTCLARRA